jgi:ribosome-associated toxin RatA of RatAB toxin-antitoxin module
MREVKRSALVAQRPERMYELINDIEKYPDFVPWCSGARIESRTEHEIVATLAVRRGPLKTEFTTRNTLVPHSAVRMELVSGPFRRLHGLWELTPIGETGTRVDLALTFEFDNALTAAILEPLFESTAGSMVDAFVARARKLSASAPV